eukprot:scaffold81885_cov18-Tisochrysis_lutea.AAC.1
MKVRLMGQAKEGKFKEKCTCEQKVTKGSHQGPFESLPAKVKAIPMPLQVKGEQDREVKRMEAEAYKRYRFKAKPIPSLSKFLEGGHMNLRELLFRLKVHVLPLQGEPFSTQKTRKWHRRNNASAAPSR